MRARVINQPRVLIVDDDPTLLQALSESLRLRIENLTVDTAESGRAALDLITTREYYDVIVTDIKMPGTDWTDGVALLAEIRTRWPDTPTLVIIGHSDHALAIDAPHGGAYDFVRKPIDLDYFVASLRREIQIAASRHQVKDLLGRHANELERNVEERTRELREAKAAIESPLRWLTDPS